MAESELKDRTQPVRFSWFVFLSAAVVSGFWGFLAGLPYGDEMAGGIMAVGGIIGGTLGLLAGLAWVRLLGPRLRTGMLKHPGSTGGLYGMGLGLAATLLLHVALACINREMKETWLFVGLPCGAISGFVLGGICGRGWAWSRLNAKPTIEEP